MTDDGEDKLRQVRFSRSVHHWPWTDLAQIKQMMAEYVADAADIDGVSTRLRRCVRVVADLCRECSSTRKHISDKNVKTLCDIAASSSTHVNTDSEVSMDENDTVDGPDDDDQEKAAEESSVTGSVVDRRPPRRKRKTVDSDTSSRPPSPTIVFTTPKPKKKPTLDDDPTSTPRGPRQPLVLRQNTSPVSGSGKGDDWRQVFVAACQAYALNLLTKPSVHLQQLLLHLFGETGARNALSFNAYVKTSMKLMASREAAAKVAPDRRAPENYFWASIAKCVNRLITSKTDAIFADALFMQELVNVAELVTTIDSLLSDKDSIQYRVFQNQADRPDGEPFGKFGEAECRFRYIVHHATRTLFGEHMVSVDEVPHPITDANIAQVTRVIKIGTALRVLTSQDLLGPGAHALLVRDKDWEDRWVGAAQSPTLGLSRSAY